METLSGKRKHQLLTQELRGKLPTLLDQPLEGQELIAQVKFFSPYSNWTWYAIEFDGDDTFFGLVHGFEMEYGYFSYSELETLTVFGGVPAVERDLHWSPRPAKEIASEIRKRGVAV